MNANEVIANRAIEILGGELGSKKPVHPNDDVNTQPVLERHVSDGDVDRGGRADAVPPDPGGPEAPRTRSTARRRSSRTIVKIGRTHLQDAVPMTLGQEISGWVSQLDHGLAHVEDALPHLQELALGGTAVGTGLNAPADFGHRVAARDREADRASRS